MNEREEKKEETEVDNKERERRLEENKFQNC
jgi:hypothetical protein